MKTIKLTLVVLLIAALSVPAMAQKTKLVISPSDTSFYVNTRHKNVTYKGEQAINQYRSSQGRSNKWKWYDGKYAGVNLFYNGLVGGINTMSLPMSASDMRLSSKSIGVDINFLDFVIFSHRSFGIVSGMGLESNNFRFRENVSLTKDAAGNTVIDNSYNDNGIYLNKSKLTTTYLNIPLLFQLQFKNNHGKNKGWMSLGVVGGLRIGSYTKVKGPQIGKQKDFNNFNLRNFHYGVMFAAGYGPYSINAKYYPHSIFDTNFGPKVEQFNVGIGLLIF